MSHRVYGKCDALKAKRLITLRTKEWEQGKVHVRDLGAKKETDETVDELIANS